MRAPPTTIEIFEELALREPREPAFEEEGEALDRGQLYGMVARCALLLQRLGVRAGDCVAVSGPGFGVQLVLLLAAEGLGAVTTSFQAVDDPDRDFLFTQARWIFSARPQQVPDGAHFQLVDDAFVRELAKPLGEEHPVWAAAPLAAPQRMTRTSGSTGRSKFMLLSRQAQEVWIATGTEKSTYRPGTRLLVLGPLVMNAAFTRASVCLRRGGTVLAGGAGASLASLRPTHVWGLPLQLENLLRDVPADYVAPEPVLVATVGGAPPPALRARAAQVFRGSIKNRYGSNEAGGICEELDANGVGVLGPGVELRILDASGKELPAGQAGMIAVRTAAMVEGYIDRPAETAAAFRGGWFVSGDYGVLVGHRKLRLLGRHDDLVNIGGLKYPAADLEADLRKQPGIADCAVQAMDQGEVSLGVAVVCAPGVSHDAALQQVGAALASWGAMKVQVVFVAELPVLSAGKIDRMALLRVLRQQAAG